MIAHLSEFRHLGTIFMLYAFRVNIF